MADFDRFHTLTALIHGVPGAGKTPSSLTGPGPVLVLDVEGRSRFVQRPRVIWDPEREAPPADDGTWELCIVQARDWRTIKAAVEWIISGNHPFRGVVFDSVTEAQKRAKDKITGAQGDAVLSDRLWGTLLTEMDLVLRQLRDATTHPEHPVQYVILTAITELRDERHGPWVQGSLVKTLPGLVDVIGYLFVDDEDEAGAASKAARRMLVAPHSSIVAKDATSELPGGGISGHFGSVVTGPIDWTKILNTIFA